MTDGKIKVSVKTVTPRMAQQLLDANDHNRRVRPHLVDEYARDMSAGRWDTNGETIKISDEGVLLDGQHRLAAVVKADVSVEMVVVENLPEVMQETVDTGAKRMTSDVLTLRGESNTPILAAIAKKVMIFVRTGNKDVQVPYNKPTTIEVADAIDKYPMLREATAFAMSHRNTLPIGPSVLGFAFWACSMRDERDAAEFFDQLVTGSGLETGDPSLTLRNKLIEKRSRTRGGLDEREVLAMVFRAWNVYRKGGKVTILRFGKHESFPIPK
jgi:hypothetical protein